MKKALIKYDNELKSILENAYNSPDKVLKASLAWEADLRNASIQEISENISDFSQNTEGYNYSEIDQLILEAIEKDQELIKRLNSTIKKAEEEAEAKKQVIVKDYPDFSKGEMTYSLSTNKMEIILNGVKELVNKLHTQKSPEYLSELIAEQKLPEGYEYNIDSMPEIGKDDGVTVYGNSKNTFLKAALTYLKKATVTNVVKLWSAIDSSAIAHIIPIPEKYRVEGFDECTFSYSDDKTPDGLVIHHSFYSFGGQRGEPRYGINGKKHGPEDCSSMVGKLTGCKPDKLPSTFHYLYSFRNQLNEEGNKGLETDPYVLESTNNFEAISVKDPQKDIRPGMLYVFRNFRNDPTKLSDGAGGHTAIVLGTSKRDDNNLDIVTDSCARDMPNLEGRGIQKFEFNRSHVKDMFFRAK
ncbi:MAG: hypothetical protein J0H68_04245 [Sphingobacteriia bacterium]|nr:hypothetical protein [Sphingobacteriia bacterium]